MKDDLKRLKLLGKNYSDLRTISAYCQDSIVKIEDIKYLKIELQIKEREKFLNFLKNKL